jgi:hypothetical protein
MKKYPPLILTTLFAIAVISCDSPGNKTEELNQEQNMEELASAGEANKIIAFEEIQVKVNPDAMLDIYSPLGNEDFNEGKVPFSFNIRNHGLGRENPLMLSLNGATPKPYSQPDFQLDLKKGTYRAVAFLLNEDGLALKEYGNFSERDFTVAGSNPFPEDDLPYLVLHLPFERQTYSEGEPVVVDFLYLGGGPESDGVKFKIEVDEQFLITYKITVVQIKNLSKGPHRIKVSLVNASNHEELDGIFSSQTRNIQVN